MKHVANFVVNYLSDAVSFYATEIGSFIPDFKKGFKKRGNVHFAIQSSLLCKTLNKTNVNKENHTLGLTEIMQYGLIG